MREIRLSGSAGGETGLTGLPYPDSSPSLDLVRPGRTLRMLT